MGAMKSVNGLMSKVGVVERCGVASVYIRTTPTQSCLRSLLFGALWRSKDPSRSHVTTVRETTLRRLLICTGEGLMFELKLLVNGNATTG